MLRHSLSYSGRTRTGERLVEVKTLVVLNDPAYGTERSYNGLRLAHALAKRDSEEVRVLGDAVSCGLTGQQTPNGYDNLERIVAGAIERGTKVGLCGTCMDARAIREEHPHRGRPLEPRGAHRLDRLGPTRS